MNARLVTYKRLTLIAALLLAGCSDSSSSAPDASTRDGALGDSAGRDSAPGDGPQPAVDLWISDGDQLTADGALPPPSSCGPLPAPSGTVVNVTPSQAAQLPGIVSQAQSGTTILLGDGVYTMSGNESQRRLSFSTPGVTLRSASGQREAVIIDGEYQTLELISIRAAEITIGQLTLRRAVDHLIHASGHPSGVTNTVLYDLLLEDSGEQFVKVNSDGQGNYVDQGRLECSLLQMTAQGRTNVETNPGGCYTGGIDAHGAWGWQVRRNSFAGIYCDNGSLAEHAIHFWSASRDTLVEQNKIFNCARGIGFGLVQSGNSRDYPDDPYPGVGYIGHYDGVIRNNLIHVDPEAAAFYDTGIELDQARGALVLHNTVAAAATFSSIDYRFENTRVTIQNNLVHNITARNGAQATADHNLQDAPLDLFVDWAGRDYRLTPGSTAAIDQGVSHPQAGLDLNDNPHDNGPPDLGAYELQPTSTGY